MKYVIGQRVWWATCNTHEGYVECPDCGGTGRLRVIFHDETQVSIDCRNCALGYDKPTGWVKYWAREPRAESVTITGVEITEEKTTWHTSRSYLIEEDRLFDTELEAAACAATLMAEWNAREQARILTKEKDTHTWAWNASYHRQCLKRAQKEIEYHTAKLNVAKVKAKEPEPA